MITITFFSTGHRISKTRESMSYTHYQLLSKNQRDNIYKNQKRQLGKYFALWSESGHLYKYMVTLSPSTNTLNAAIALRKNFFDKLNNVKHYNKFEIAYFSAVEIGRNKNTPSKKAQLTEAAREKLKQQNYHLHIQILTDMKESDLKKVIHRIDPNLCYFHTITTPKVKGARYDYVCKDIKTIDWKLQYKLKTQHKSKILYTSSRKEFANYMITKLWAFLKAQYKDKWKNLGDKYSFVLNLKKNGDLLLSNTSINSGSYSNPTMYDKLHIKENNSWIYIKKNLF